MTKLTESTIENWVIALLQTQGYAHIHGTDLAPDMANSERARHEGIWVSLSGGQG